MSMYITCDINEGSGGMMMMVVVVVFAGIQHFDRCRFDCVGYERGFFAEAAVMFFIFTDAVWRRTCFMQNILWLENELMRLLASGWLVVVEWAMSFFVFVVDGCVVVVVASVFV